MPENEVIKARILELLSERPHSKEEIKQTLWIQSDRKLEFILREMRRDKLIYLENKKYVLEPQNKVIKRVSRPASKKVVKHEFQIVLLRIMFAFLSIGASIMSIRNTSRWLIESFPIFFAYLLSGIMSVFMVASMGVAVILWMRKQYLLAVVVGVMWAIITITSVSSTVIGMYNANKDSFVQKQTVTRLDNVTQMTYNELEKQEKDIQRLIDDRTTTMGRLNTRIEGLSTDTPEYQTLATQIFQAENFIRVRVAEKRSITDKKLSLLGTMNDTEVIARSFYEEMELLFGISAAMIHFILSCFVAILVDGIAPLSASMALFLKEELHEISRN